ncbi:Myosin-VIIb [Cricetulus griseus]|uniref:Myosin-VIIb n=1 Tax=Cricetulus griseus TaxID=10029 RepID=G3HKJ0_CRIGR|nr:Myosin-VIIb [Cricetulus griseus]
MSVFRLGDHVWLDPPSTSKTTEAIGGIVKETKPGKVLIEDDEGKEHWIHTEDLSNLRAMHTNSAQGVDDMIRLGDLNEAGVVHNLLVRYKQHKIYGMSKLLGLYVWSSSSSPAFLQESFMGPQKVNPVAYWDSLVLPPQG